MSAMHDLYVQFYRQRRIGWILRILAIICFVAVFGLNIICAIQGTWRPSLLIHISITFGAGIVTWIATDTFI